MAAAKNSRRVSPRREARRRVLRCLPQGAVGAEIGVFKGAFSDRLLAVAQPRKLYLIDPWENMSDPGLVSSWYHEASRFDMDQIYDEVVVKYADVVKSGQVEIMRMRSSEAMATIADGALDFVYIDGDHRYEGVLHDLQLAMRKTGESAVIALDDYQLGGWWGDGVIRAVNTFLGQQSGAVRIALCLSDQIVLQKIPK